jgi:sarcosine oxidase, subunit delta
MLLINCPYCGPRPELEFSYGGEAHLTRPSPAEPLTDEQWADFQYGRTNPRGLHAERWRHARGCGQFFNAVRDTTTDQFLCTYRIGEPRPNLPAAGGGAP